MGHVQALLNDVSKLAVDISKQKVISEENVKKNKEAVEKIAKNHGISVSEVESRLSCEMSHPSSSRT